MSLEAIEVRGRWAIVTLSERQNQCSVPDVSGGRYFVRGIGDESLARAAEYSYQHGRTYVTLRECLDAIRQVES
jgi:hypothetical protein